MNDNVLQRTESVCPVCLNRIAAAYIQRGDDVLLHKICPEHGGFFTRVWEGVESFKWWQRSNPAQNTVNPEMPEDKGCPYDCGLCCAHKQATCCVLLELTQNCNMACPICFASAGKSDSPNPSMRRVGEWYDMLLAHGGPFNIQLSGGEPTTRDDLPDIIRMGREKGFTFFQLNTNGLRLAEDKPYLQALVDAGLNTVFMQFDGLDSWSSVALRGEDTVEKKKVAIANCGDAGLGVVLVPTVKRGINDEELAAILDFAVGNMPVVRGVHFQPISYFGRYGDAPAEDEHITIPGLLSAIERQTGGRVKAGDFQPGGAEHALCSFHADYIVTEEGWQLLRSAGQSTAACCLGLDKSTDVEEHLGVGNTSDVARENVARKWSAPGCCDCGPDPEGYDLSALDEFLFNKRNRTLAISGMCFQDAWNLDLNRLSRCYINIVDVERNCLVPFCSYNLTSSNGRSLYRQRSGKHVL